ncbi:MAG: hypothetical protein U1B30_13645 [Pseudomonadota bacterium]|nr:hypothetical protein [Pseudomonadota bacterium]
MKNSISRTLILPSILLLLTACNDKAAPSSSNTASSAVATPIATDAWVGKWNGPEGTFLEISGGNGNYTITIQDLDGPKQFQGKSNGNEISFERNGTTEAIQPSNGTETGMKWLAEKSDCLRVRLGEGWCRD